MDLILIVLTVLSLAAAAVFAVSAWRARAEADERSAARVAALASAIGAEAGAGERDPGSERRDHDRIPDPGSRIPVSSMFGTLAGSSARPLRAPAIVAAAGAAAIVAGGAVLRSGAPAADDRSSHAPLELVSMRHTREGGTLTVIGLVRNPPTGTPVSNVAAHVVAFDRGGTFVASGRGTLELPVLAPGDEAAFSVTVSALADLGRYRISFRTPAGPLRHLDRRGARQLVRAP